MASGFEHMPKAMGIVFGIAIFGCAPTWFVIMTLVLHIVDNQNERWFERNAVLLRGEVVDKFQTRDSGVFLYRTDEDPETTRRERVGAIYDDFAIGDEIFVWRAGDEYRIRRGIGRYPWGKALLVLIPPALLITGLGWWGYRRAARWSERPAAEQQS